MDIRVVLVTAPDQEIAAQIAQQLVAQHLVACANIIPGLRSIYRWQGKVEDASEVLLVLKTTTAQVSKLEAALNSVHPYDVPEFIVMTPEKVSHAYAEWCRENTRPWQA